MTHDKPRLLVITSTFPRWPDDHEPPFVYELARRLTDSFDVTVLAPHAPGALREEVMDGVHVHRFRYAPDQLERLAYDGGIPVRLRRQPWLALLVPSFVLAMLGSAIRLTRALDPSIVHAHWLLPGGLVGAIVKELLPGKRSLVTTLHGADAQLGDRWPLGALQRLVADSTDTLTVVSRALRDKVAPLVPKSTRVEVAPMGVDLHSRFVPASEPVCEPILIFAGRLVEKKGVADLLDAMPLVREKHPETRLLIVGHGPLEDELREHVHRLDLERAIDFVGSVPNDRLGDTLRRASIATLPFRVARDGDVEGLGLVAVEAMGCALAVVVGDVPAVHDVVEHERSGLIVAAQNPVALAGAIVRLLDEPDTRAQLATNGRQAALSGFDWSVAVDRYRALFEDLL